MSFNDSTTNIVHGEGKWAPGTQVREIEGHFHKEHEPQGVAPISSSGGVPNVDYSTKDKIEDAVTGHHRKSGHHGTESGMTGSGLTGSNDSGLAGRSGEYNQTGDYNNNNSGATSGISSKAEEQLEKGSGDHNPDGNSRVGDMQNKAQNLAQNHSTADGNAGTLSDRTGDSSHPSQAHSTTGAGGHHGSTDSPTGTHGSTVPHKEGVLDKIKHAMGK